MLEDSTNKQIEVPVGSMFYMYPVQDWINWEAARVATEIARRDRSNKTLLNQVKLLKEILTNQGIRVVTNEQARQLGLTT